MTRDPKVELIFFSGCPHAGAARTNLELALSRVGRAPEWQEWDLRDPHTPERTTRYASPTVLVEGRDVNGEARRVARGSLSCRTSGAPSVDQIVAGLNAAEGDVER